MRKTFPEREEEEERERRRRRRGKIAGRMFKIVSTRAPSFEEGFLV